MLSASEFEDSLDWFVAISDELKDGWYSDSVGGHIFARKKCVAQVNRVETQLNSEKSNSAPKHYEYGNDTDNCHLDFEEGGLEDDSSCALSTSTESETISYEYHIVYSQSYSVPVLYLNVLNSSGKRVSLEEVWNLCPDWFQSYLHTNKWTTLTQQEHPLLGIPYLMLHPCHTADLMAQVTRGSTRGGKGNYLVTWLSTMGPLVGIKLSAHYAMPHMTTATPKKDSADEKEN